MPNLVTVPHQLSDIIDCFDPPQNRKPGWHVTDLYYAAEAISKGKLDGFVHEKLNVPWVDDSGMPSWGRMWEGAVRDWVDKKTLDMGLLFLPPEPNSPGMVVDGIIANLDGQIICGDPLTYDDEHNVAVVEMKATTGSNSPFDHLNWIAQTKAYCHMIGVNQVWFIVLHMPRRGAPTAKVYQHIVTFEDWEITENWQMLISTKEYLESKGIKLWLDTQTQ